MTTGSLRRLAILAALLIVPAALGAGVNTWTGGRPVATLEGASTIVAAHPSNPDVVFAAFGARLHRSGDGGRTWSRLRSFEEIRALLVHPAAPTAVYVAAYEIVGDEYHSGIFKSTDNGETWTRSLDDVYATVLAGSPTDASTVFAGSGGTVYRTTDGGATWFSSNSISGWLASLVIHPREPNVAYAGAEGYDYWGLTSGSVVKTNDGGARWLGATPANVEGVSAVAVDAVALSTVYIGTAPYLYSDSTTLSDVMRSEDGGATWLSAGDGLRGKGIEVLTVDPQVSGMLYAGTSAGLYRSGSGGRSWTMFGRQLSGSVVSLDRRRGAPHLRQHDGGRVRARDRARPG